MAHSAINIGLLWHSANSGNLGVGALTIANMAIAEQVASEVGLHPNFTIIGMRDVGPSYLDEAAADVFVVDRRSLLDPAGCWKVIGDQDCVLDIGAGDSFTEIYGPKRFAFLWLTKLIAILRGRPLLLSPQTIGPFRRPAYIALARMVLQRAFAVVVRDDASLQALRKIAPAARGVLAVDVAFALPYNRSAKRRQTRTRVGVNVSGLLFNEAVSGRNRFGLTVDYAALMRRFVEKISKLPDVEVHLVTHAIDAAGGDDDDAAVADLFAHEFPDAIRAPTFRDPVEAKSYIATLDYLVAGRMHACIAAFSAGVPVVPIAYSRKFSGLFGMLGYDRLVPVQGKSTDEALNFLMESFTERQLIAEEMKLGMTRVSALLDAYRAELRRLLSRVEK